MKRLLFLFVIIPLTGCDRPGDHPISPNCTWIEEDSRVLNLNENADRRHLRYDAIVAEDMSIRWADKHFGHTPEYDSRQYECMQTMFRGVAVHHGVDIGVVRQYSRRRDVFVDAAVILGFGVLYAVVAYIFAGRIRRRFPPDEPGFWVMTIAMAIGISLVGFMVGNLWSIVVETFLLNSAHLSYRMNWIPWRQHWVLLFLYCLAIFVLATVARSRVAMRVKTKPSV